MINLIFLVVYMKRKIVKFRFVSNERCVLFSNVVGHRLCDPYILQKILYFFDTHVKNTYRRAVIITHWQEHNYIGQHLYMTSNW
jgi:hypothetical protein